MPAWIAFMAGLLTVIMAGNPAVSALAPGPESMTAEEAAIEADPSSGANHAVILLEETDRSDDMTRLVAGRLFPAPSRLQYHLRAKVLSSQGRDLANVEIPLPFEDSELTGWWGFTIRPDGSVLQLYEEDLVLQDVLSVEDEVEVRVLKGLLPGVEPGSVIDYGYALERVPVSGFRVVEFQKEHPIRRRVYRWRPRHVLGLLKRAGACTIDRAGGLSVELSQGDGAFIVEAADLPPMVREPYMPSGDRPGASASFYYTFEAADSEAFWDDVAAAERKKERKLVSRGSIKKVLKAMGITKKTDPSDGLRAAYDWIIGEMENLGHRTAEELESVTPKQAEAEREKSLARAVKDRKARAPQLDWLFLGVARSLGVEAWTVLAADSREHQWRPEIMALGQFDERLVAVRLPDGPGDEFTLVDAGSGLPFGQLPWWVTATRGLMVTDKGHKVIDIGSTGSVANVSEAKALIRLSGDEGEAARISWSFKGKGQYGYVTRRALRRLGADGRRERLESMCLGEGSSEVLSAESPGLDAPRGQLALQCETETTELVELPAEGELRVRVDGPWIPRVPRFTSSERVHPIVFDYPWTDLVTVTIEPPEGFGVGRLPEPLSVEGPYGSYHLIPVMDGKRLVLQRSLRMIHKTLPAESLPGLRAFLSQVMAGDSRAIVLMAEGGGTQ